MELQLIFISDVINANFSFKLWIGVISEQAIKILAKYRDINMASSAKKLNKKYTYVN